ncbi:MAG: amidophosphoribosyltransferase [Ruminococcus sp.]|nr:amidophosphoribosyltransferase [Ruminococcus sp.]MCD7801047.1 amidophosphoribosyltransferase [Ruminococcus sp.]
MLNGLHEECGVFGIYSPNTIDVATPTYFALYALQHRGQESCGIVVNDRGLLSSYKDLGLVHEVFNHNRLENLGKGNMAIGHVRYSTTGNSNRENAQPLVVRHIKGPMAIAHNGNLVNARELREEYENKGAIFHSTNDTEVISYAITEERLKTGSIEDAVQNAITKLKGAFSLVIMSPTKLIAVRDSEGFRPLCLGKLDDDGSYVVASESCAFDSIGATFIRDIKAGEMLVIDKNGVRSITNNCTKKGHMCVFEYVYFARPDSVIEGVSVHKARLRAGELLWKEHPVDADVVIGVPDSGLDCALGFSKASKIPYGVGFIKNRYIGRTFIQPSQAQRTNSVRIKLNVIKDTVKDKRVVLIDDSIVRGTTCRHIVELLREAGAKEVHMMISCPPFIAPCFFGVDIDSKDRLIACQMSIPEIAKHIGADSLGYLSVDGVKSLASEADCDFCVGCFTNKYPIDVPSEMPKDKFEFRIGESSNN